MYPNVLYSGAWGISNRHDHLHLRGLLYDAWMEGVGRISLSDHRYIDFWTEGKGEDLTYYRNVRKTNWKRFRTDLRENLQDFPKRYGTPLEIDRAVEEIEWAITRAFEDNCPLSVKADKKGNVLWNKKLDDLKKRVKRLYRKQRKNRALRDEYLRYHR